jgi:hypothetical protein
MLLEKENNRLLTIYDSLLQLYVLRDEARRSQNWRQEATLKRDIEAVEQQWQSLRAKRKGSFN